MDYIKNVVPVRLLIFQGTTLCNISCKYCYLPLEDRNRKEQISIATVLKTIENLLNSNLISESIEILWHAGEPMVLPIEFYKDIFNKIRSLIPMSIKISHSFQTNATLITDEWCDFIKNENLEIGISLDGPQFLNDLNRLNKGNKSTFTKVISGIEKFKKHSIDLHIISVLTDSSLNYSKEIFDFFHGLSIKSLGFNVEEIEGAHYLSSFSGKHSEYIKTRTTSFFESFFKLYLDNEKPFKLREYEWVKQRILYADLTNKKHHNSDLTEPYAIITVDTKGNYTTFSPELITQKSKNNDDFILGNIFTSNFKQSIKTKKFKQIYSEILAGINVCKNECEYFSLCRGGTPSNKNSEHGLFNVGETIYCNSAIKAPIDALLKLTDTI